MNLGPGNPGSASELLQLFPVIAYFIENDDSWRLEPCFNLIQRVIHWCRRIVNSWVRGYGNKLVKAWPRNTPAVAPFG